MKANPKEAAELGDFLGNTAKSAMIGKIIAAPLKYAGDAWTKFSLANPNYYVPAEFGSAVSKLEYLDEIASGQLTTTSSRVAAQTTAAGLRKEIILKSGMDKSEILKFFGDGDDILAIIDEMDNVVGGEGGSKSTTSKVVEIEGFLPDEYYSGNYSTKPPLIKDSSGNVKLYRTVSKAEYNSLISGKPFTSIEGSMDSKWLSTTIDDANAWGQKMDFGGNYKIIEITVPESVVDGLYYGGLKLDGIGPAYNGTSDMLNQYISTIQPVK